MSPANVTERISPIHVDANDRCRLTIPDGTAGVTERYRLVIFNRKGDDVLLSPNGQQRELPRVEVPQFTRTIEQLNAIVLAKWKITTLHLFSDPAPASTFGLSTVALEALEDGSKAHGLVWQPIRDVPLVLRDPGEAEIIQSVHGIAVRRVGRSERAPFGHLGWIYELQHWLKSSAGIHEVLSLSQLAGSDETCLLRLVTPSKTLWYKAVGQSNSSDFTNTLALANCVPRYLPSIVASDPALKAWVSESGGEKTLRESSDFEIWASIARQLARMQIASVTDSSHLLDSGFVDLRCRTLREHVNPFFEFMDSLMKQQTKTEPAPLAKRELSNISDILARVLSELDALGFPDAVGHSDFNPGNILLNNDHGVFIDWHAAHVGIPILTLEYLIAHHRKTCAVLRGQEYFLRLAYREQWLSLTPDSTMRRGQELSPLVAAYASAIASGSWRDPVRLAMPRTPGYLRSLARIMNREAQSLLAGGKLG